MNVAALWGEIEAEQEWREREMRFFQNHALTIADDEQQDQFRRALVLLLYSHFEGFCKFAFTLYVNAVNSVGLTCAEANSAIAAASLADLFQSLRNPEKKAKEFKADLPDDTQLHRFALDREFIEKSMLFLGRTVNIPAGVVDMDSNLKPAILRRNLYRLGFPHDQFRDDEWKIDLLLEYRNSIAHGKFKGGVSLKQYTIVQNAATEITNAVKRAVMRALAAETYRRTA